MQRNRFAFTLIELLVVVAIIALLIAILLPALARSRRTAKEVVCAADLRTLTQVSIIYANDNNNHLPRLQHNPVNNANQIYPYWVYNYWRDLMENRYGLQRSHFYSPNNTIWNDDGLYYYGWDGVHPNTATNLVMGRFYFGSAGLVDSRNFLNYIVDPLIPTRGTIFATTLSDKPAVDLMWTDLNRQMSGQFDNGGNRYGSNHMYDPQTNWPSGTHNGHLDGSVEWIGSSQIKLRVDYANGIQLYW